ncbi:hypothetical protein EDD69_1128 [Thermolongibacillus altinsuensis]|uniref:Uncharacterized protein n=1 Tax=Thermolongibacillus altinsuensis TaxID=575256 RepID=A0A4R1QC45_9BACL|nr:hypothetical protein EDD69_1128 [Thermolongibacillus altinsuensis]
MDNRQKDVDKYIEEQELKEKDENNLNDTEVI